MATRDDMCLIPNHEYCTDFANVSAADASDMLNVGIYFRADSNSAGNSMGISNAGIAGRWVY